MNARLISILLLLGCLAPALFSCKSSSAEADRIVELARVMLWDLDLSRRETSSMRDSIAKLEKADVRDSLNADALEVAKRIDQAKQRVHELKRSEDADGLAELARSDLDSIRQSISGLRLAIISAEGQG